MKKIIKTKNAQQVMKLILIVGQKLFLTETQKSLFLPYIWYGKAIFLLKKGMYRPGLGF